MLSAARKPCAAWTDESKGRFTPPHDDRIDRTHHANCLHEIWKLFGMVRFIFHSFFCCN